MLGLSDRWVQANKSKMRYRRKGKRSLEFELSSVLALEQSMGINNDAA
jgi:hypothetical protein